MNQIHWSQVQKSQLGNALTQRMNNVARMGVFVCLWAEFTYSFVSLAAYTCIEMRRSRLVLAAALKTHQTPFKKQTQMTMTEHIGSRVFVSLRSCVRTMPWALTIRLDSKCHNYRNIYDQVDFRSVVALWQSAWQRLPELAIHIRQTERGKQRDENWDSIFQLFCDLNECEFASSLSQNGIVMRSVNSMNRNLWTHATARIL